MQSSADGIHVGNSDCSPLLVRQQWPDCGILGYSLEWEAQLQKPDAAVSDYIALSPVFATGTKTDTVTEWGLAGIQHIRSLTSKPLVAIGNVNTKNAAQIIRAGASCLAVVSAICSAKDPEKAAAELRNEIEKATSFTLTMKRYTYRSILTIAGSDSGGGAGIQADLKTFSALGCFGTSAITAITVQNTTGVSGIHNVPAAFVAAQITAVMDDIRPAAIKIGMVHSAELAHAISQTLLAYPDVPVIFDPVMVATSGDKLIEDDTVAVIKEVLFPLSTLITPNLDEAIVLAGKELRNVEDMKVAATSLLQTGCNAVLLKGGHLKGESVYDVYVDREGQTKVYTSPYIESCNVHGTGCTLSSAIAAYVALGFGLEEAISKARNFIWQAIDKGKDVQTGKGNGPLNHFFNPQQLKTYELE